MNLGFLLAVISQISALGVLVIVLASLVKKTSYKILIGLAGIVFAIVSYFFIPTAVRNNYPIVFMYTALLISAKASIANFIKKLPPYAIRNALLIEIPIIASFLIVRYISQNLLIFGIVAGLFPITQALIYAYLHKQIHKNPTSQN